MYSCELACRHMCACVGMGEVQRALEATFGELVVVTDTCVVSQKRK